MLGLEATDEAKAVLISLADEDGSRAVFRALRDRIHALRVSPDDPAVRGRVFRVLDNTTVRVPIVFVPETGEEWAIAWELVVRDSGPAIRLTHIERLP